MEKVEMNEIGKEKIQTKKLDGTPFHLIIEEDGVTLGIKNYTLTKKMIDEEAIKKYIEDNGWELIAIIASVVAYDTLHELKKQEECK